MPSSRRPPPPPLCERGGVGPPGSAAAWMSAPARSSSARSGVRNSRWWSGVDKWQVEESRGDVVAAAIDGDVLRRVVRRGAGEGAAGAGGGEELYDVEVAVLAGDVHRRVAIGAGPVHVGVGSEQLRDDLGISLLAGHVQRREAIAQIIASRCLIHLGVCSEQLRDNLGTTPLAGDVQRRDAFIAGLVHLGAQRAASRRPRRGRSGWRYTAAWRHRRWPGSRRRSQPAVWR